MSAGRGLWSDLMLRSVLKPVHKGTEVPGCLQMGKKVSGLVIFLNQQLLLGAYISVHNGCSVRIHLHAMFLLNGYLGPCVLSIYVLRLPATLYRIFSV